VALIALARRRVPVEGNASRPPWRVAITRGIRFHAPHREWQQIRQIEHEPRPIELQRVGSWTSMIRKKSMSATAIVSRPGPPQSVS